MSGHEKAIGLKGLLYHFYFLNLKKKVGEIVKF